MTEMTRFPRHCYSVTGIPQSIINKAVNQWTAQLRACVKPKRHYFEDLL